MFVPSIIIKKKRGEELSKEEIDFLIQGYTNNTIPDYQMSSLLMAICLKGMSEKETAYLCQAMINSGEVVDLSNIEGLKVDKHSTGGVGDKTSLVLGPMVASLGGKVAKLSGRGLGHTGGTLDKLESIPGFNINLSIAEFKEAVRKVGLAIIGQTSELDPADKKLYALRDVTGTVDCIPLIATSIMSKKLSTGTDCILLDVKYGSGAFFEDINDSIELAKCMVKIGKNMNKDTKAIISNMNQPLGNAIGNSLEVIEAINTLHGNGPKDLVDLVVNAGSIMLVQAKIYDDINKAKIDLEKSLKDGSAFNKFVEFVKQQGGDISYILDPSKFPKAKYTIEVLSKKEGYVEKINTIGIGQASLYLGAGRAKKEDSIDYSAGIIVNKKPGDHVNEGELLATLYTNKEDTNYIIDEVINDFVIVNNKTNKLNVIDEVIG